MVSNLLAVQMSKGLKKRRILIQQLEDDGWHVDFVHGSYEASKAEEKYAIPPRKCPACNKWKSLATFISVGGIEHPWCVECRFGNQAGAERVRAELANRVAHRQSVDDLLGIVRCKNPACPNGGVIPPDKLRHGHTFCSMECKESMAAPRADQFHPCENPVCPGQQQVRSPARFCSQACKIAATYLPCSNPTCPYKKLIPPGRKYCSRACVVEHHVALGLFQAMSAKGNQVIADYLAIKGEMPHALERSQAVSKSNRDAPPKKKMAREDRVQGHLVRFIPDAESGLYRVQVDGIPDISVAAAPTKKQAQRLVAAALRNRERDQA